MLVFHGVPLPGRELELQGLHFSERGAAPGVWLGRGEQSTRAGLESRLCARWMPFAGWSRLQPKTHKRRSGGKRALVVKEAWREGYMKA